MCSVLGDICAHLCTMLCWEQCCCNECLDTDVPFLEKHLTVPFVDAVLKSKRPGGQKPALDSGASVLSVTAQSFGTGDGLLSQMFRLTMTYHPANAGPKTIVCKMSPPNPKARLTGSLLSLFKYEDAFYRNDISSATKLNAPTCYYTGIGSYGRYCIFLSDFAPAKTEDQLVGLTIPQAEEALTQVSKLHAKYRGRVGEDPTLSWVLKQHDSSYFEVVFSEFKKKYKNMPSALASRGMNDPKEWEKLMECGRWLNDHGASVFIPFITSSLRRLDKKHFPSTLIHGDYRAENFLFPQNGLKDFMVFDFQLMKELNGMNDVSYMLISSMTVKDVSANERKLLMCYMKAMRANGADDLTWAEILIHYQISIATMVLITFFTVVDNVTADDAKTANMSKSYVRRCNMAVTSWNLMGCLKMILDKATDQDFAFTREELKSLIPKRYHDLFHSDEASSVDQSDVKVDEA